MNKKYEKNKFDKFHVLDSTLSNRQKKIQGGKDNFEILKISSSLSFISMVWTGHVPHILEA